MVAPAYCSGSYAICGRCDVSSGYRDVAVTVVSSSDAGASKFITFTCTMGIDGSTLYEDGSLYFDVGTSADSCSIATQFAGFILGTICLDVAIGNLDTNMTYCKTVAPHSARTNSGSTYPSALRVISAARSHVSAEYVNEPINSEFFNFIDYLDAARTNSGSACIFSISAMGDYVTRFYDHCSKPGVGVSYESISADSRSSRNIAATTHF